MPMGFSDILRNHQYWIYFYSLTFILFVTGSSMKENSLEITTALQAIRLASRLCQKVRKELAEGASIQKIDRSPVTIADYGSQAIICKLIKEAFPNDIVVAEEDSAELKKPDHSSLLHQVQGFILDFFPGSSSDEVCSWIELSSRLTQNRFWTLDPIDGTKGFLRGDQYAIALALIENGSVILGLLACPSLYVNSREPQGKRGCFFIASRGDGSFQMDIGGGGERGN